MCVNVTSLTWNETNFTFNMVKAKNIQSCYYYRQSKELMKIHFNNKTNFILLICEWNSKCNKQSRKVDFDNLIRAPNILIYKATLG